MTNKNFIRLPAKVNKLAKSVFKVLPAGEDLGGVLLKYAKFSTMTNQTPIPNPFPLLGKGL